MNHRFTLFEGGFMFCMPLIMCNYEYANENIERKCFFTYFFISSKMTSGGRLVRNPQEVTGKW
jgi:hypothetical protein